MKDLIEYLAKNIVNNPDDVEITEEQRTSDYSKGATIYTIKVNKEDMGLIIGKGGQTIQSIRNIAKVRAIKEQKYVDVKVFDPEFDNKIQKDDTETETTKSQEGTANVD